MTPGKELDILGFGPSAISQLDGAFAQNHKTSGDWQRALTQDFAVGIGLQLTNDDRLRRELMQQLYGYGTIDGRNLEVCFGIDFESYFAEEKGRLVELVDDGLVTVGQGQVRLTEPLGRLLVRVVAAVFDRYLPPDAFRTGLAPQMASKAG